MIRVSIGLLPERFSALAEELVDEGGDAVGERVGVEQRIVERVPLQRAVEPDLEVVAAAPGVVEYAAHAVAEAAISLRKSRWDNDLATPSERRVSLSVCEDRKSYYPLGLGQACPAPTIKPATRTPGSRLTPRVNERKSL